MREKIITNRVKCQINYLKLISNDLNINFTKICIVIIVYCAQCIINYIIKSE